MKSAFVICARLDSRRAPGKALRPICGRPLMQHLIDRLRPTAIPIILAVPEVESKKWESFRVKNPDVLFFSGFDSDPLARTYEAALKFKAESVIRVTHDKIFIDPADVLSAFNEYMRKGLDYLYSSTQTAGCGFEIISLNALASAREKFSDVEHISYAIKAVTQNSYDMPMPGVKGLRFLIDYEEDLLFLETVMASIGPDCSKKQAEKYCLEHEWAQSLNRLPTVTIYTAGYNAEKWLETCLQSVKAQDMFSRCEYILIDDHSTDRTMEMMAKFKAMHSNVRLIRNPKNLGLASSSNVALKESRGRYIVRLDADDFFMNSTAVSELLKEITDRDLDVVYPANYFGSLKVIQRPDDKHHVGGAMFKTAALNHLKFTDGLRGFEGLDLWARAREQLKIGYFHKPIFFYRQHTASLSKNNLEAREKIKETIEARHGFKVPGN